ncbi:MAG TPA: hypothetical protein VJU14_07335 [Solirubrobacterales bacterium]|nr:hypothetical protein [Solirubrobacterales bacterium]
MIGNEFRTGLGRRSIAGLTAVLALAALLAGLATATASASFVSASSGSDAGNDCSDQYEPCATIQHAIDELVPNPFVSFPSISVAPGVYGEQLSVDKSVTLHGPNSSLDGRGPEAVIEGGIGTAITPEAPNVTITGFTISTADAGTPIRTLGSDVDRLTISGNIIEGGTSGVWLGAGGDETNLSLNRIKADEFGIRLGAAGYGALKIWYNRLTGPDASMGVFAGPDTEIDGFELEGNEFATAGLGASIRDGSVLANKIEPPPGGVGLRANLTGSYVRENSFRGGGTGSCLRLLGGHNGLDPSSQVHVGFNEFSGCAPYALQLGPEVEAISITANAFPGSQNGVVTDDSTPWNVPSSIKVSGNRFVGLANFGVENAVGGELDASNNWWGCNDGPGAPGCDSVSSGVDAVPNVYLAAEAVENEESDLIFSPAPVSALNPGEQALIRAHLRNGGGGEALNVSLITEDPAYFSSLKGELSRASDFWQNAHASSVFTAGSQPGPAEVIVEMDNERVEVPLTINGKLPAPSVAPSPSPPNGRPRIRIRRGPLSLSKRNVVIGMISCAQSACRVDQESAEVRLGRTRFDVKLKMPAGIPAENTRRIRMILPERAFGRLSRHGMGTLTVTIKITDATRAAASTTRRVKVEWGR